MVGDYDEREKRIEELQEKLNTFVQMQLAEILATRISRYLPAAWKVIGPPQLSIRDAARQDGRWAAAYASQSAQTIPDDFRLELDRHPKAKEFFETLNTLNRYAICHRIETARKPATRKTRIETFIGMLARNEKIYT